MSLNHFYFGNNSLQTIMTTFIKTKFKISDDQTNCGPESHLRKVQYRIRNHHQISQSEITNIEIGPETMKLCLN